MKIILLGTSSATPTLYRGLSSTALIREGDVFLFDCGEGTQIQLMRAGIRRSKIHSIFIGHLHGDHLYGINGLLSLRGEQRLRLAEALFHLLALPQPGGDCGLSPFGDRQPRVQGVHLGSKPSHLRLLP